MTGLTEQDLNDIEAQLDSSVPSYVVRLVRELREARRQLAQRPGLVLRPGEAGSGSPYEPQAFERRWRPRR